MSWKRGWVYTESDAIGRTPITNCRVVADIPTTIYREAAGGIRTTNYPEVAHIWGGRLA